MPYTFIKLPPFFSIFSFENNLWFLCWELIKWVESFYSLLWTCCFQCLSLNIVLGLLSLMILVISGNSNNLILSNLRTSFVKYFI